MTGSRSVSDTYFSETTSTEEHAQMKISAFERALPRMLRAHLSRLVLVVIVVGCSSQVLPTITPPAGGDGLGNECQASTSVTATEPTLLAINPSAPECASGVCLLPAQERTTDTSALCTDACVTDADCLGGQIRDPSAAADHRCTSGFACRALIPNVSNVPFACQRLCVCRDFLAINSPDTPAPGCE